MSFYHKSLGATVVDMILLKAFDALLTKVSLDHRVDVD